MNKYLILTFVLMCGVIFILPFFSVPSYTILVNTTSHLGAQQSPNAWIMNLTFVLLGMTTLISGFGYLRGFLFQQLILSLFSIALISTAFFRHAPIDPIPGTYNAMHDKLHSVFASITGFAFTLFAISMVFILRKRSDKLSSLCVAILATVLSLLMYFVPEYKGVWQRLIFLFSFAWFIYLFQSDKLVRDSNPDLPSENNNS